MVEMLVPLRWKRRNGMSSIGKPKCQPRFPLVGVFGAYSRPSERCIYCAGYDRIWQELCEAVMIIEFRLAAVTGWSIEFAASSARGSLITPFLHLDHFVIPTGWLELHLLAEYRHRSYIVEQLPVTCQIEGADLIGAPHVANSCGEFHGGGGKERIEWSDCSDSYGAQKLELGQIWMNALDLNQLKPATPYNLKQKLSRECDRHSSALNLPLGPAPQILCSWKGGGDPYWHQKRSRKTKKN